MQTEPTNTERITNRHIARLLTALKETMPVPILASDKIKSELHFLRADLENYLRTERGNENNH
jgi:hypothetical protein